MKNITKTLQEFEVRTRRLRNPNSSRCNDVVNAEISDFAQLSECKSILTKQMNSKHRGRFTTKDHERLSSVSNLPDISMKSNGYNDVKQKFLKNRQNTLTRKSLKEFEKTPEGKIVREVVLLMSLEILCVLKFYSHFALFFIGKLLKSPMQYVKSVNDEKPPDQYITQDIPRVTYDLVQEEEKKLRKPRIRNIIKVNPRLPHNAGTAYIIARELRECPREESPPPFIEADVFVY